jgi:hypothetical protein
MTWRCVTPRLVTVGRGLGIAAGLIVVAGLFSNDLVRLLALVLYVGAIAAAFAYRDWRTDRDRRRALAADCDLQHDALMHGDIATGVFGRHHACTAPCAGAPGHYGPCCCDFAHLWENPEHGGRVPEISTEGAVR